MDTVLCSLQTGTQEGESSRSRSLRVRLGVVATVAIVCLAEEYFGGCMAKIIEFYIPQGFRKVSRWLPPTVRGKLLEFQVPVRKSA